MSLALIKKKGEWVLPTGARTVPRCGIDHAFSLDLWSVEDVITLRVGGAFEVHIGGKDYLAGTGGFGGYAAGARVRASFTKASPCAVSTRSPSASKLNMASC